MCRRRRAVAGQGLRTGPGVRCAAAAGRADWPAVRHPGSPGGVSWASRARGCRAARGRCPRPAGCGGSLSARRAGARSHRRRDAGQPAGVARATARIDRDRACRRIWTAGCAGVVGADRAELPAPAGDAPRRDALAAPDRGRRAGWRSTPSVAGGGADWDRALRGGWGPDRRAVDNRRTGDVSSSTGALGCLSVGAPTGTPRGAHGARRGHRPADRSGPTRLASCRGSTGAG